MLAAEKNDLDRADDVPDEPADRSDDASGGTTVEPRSPDPASGRESYASSRIAAGNREIPYAHEEISDDGSSYMTHGRVFFRSGGRSYSCSGTVVTSPNESVVWTAGHCVNHAGRQGWVEKWIFVPGYDDGRAPYGKWTARELAAPQGWVEGGSPSYDIGAAVLDPNPGGWRIAEVVGSEGIAWNLPRAQDFVIYGYPAAGMFDGGSLWACYSSYGWSDPVPGPDPLAAGCNLTYGSSGGAWIIYRAGGSYLNSVTSYSHPGERRVVYGPYFGDAAARLYETVAR